MYAYLVTTHSGTRYYVTEFSCPRGMYVAARTVTRDGDLMIGSCGDPIVCEPAEIPVGPVIGEAFRFTLPEHPDRAVRTSPVVSVDVYCETCNVYGECTCADWDDFHAIMADAAAGHP